MEFSSLYRENKSAAKELLTSMWCSEPRNERQKKYAHKIKELIDTELFASEKHIPLVQCMDLYESSSDEEAANIFQKIDKSLWEKCISPKHFNPYRHQVKAWEALTNVDGPKKSMVVTTGTGSGKTECFMIPLVNDLLNELNKNNGINKYEIQAIFLYPLNALMEDQKDRLQKLLDGTQLKFAVYNGNMPNDAGNINSKVESERNEAKRIIEERRKYPNIIPTRNEMHETHPNIILTNPTMLEYMLLRQKDQTLFTKKSLRWVVIDETHTFSGAGAAELSMLIRRVLDAFSLDAREIRFATSSATIGNAKTKEEEDINNSNLKEFISKITGADKVELITGVRNAMITDATDPEVARCRKLLQQNDYIRLDELMPGDGETVEDKLSRLDNLCSLPTSPLKAKVHFFYRVPNNGLRIQLNDHQDGVFNIKTTIPVSSVSTPYLELMRCEHCGEYFAVGESVPGESHKYRALTSSAEDLFTDDNNGPISRLVFGLTDKEVDDDARDGDNLVVIKEDEYHKEDNSFVNGWSIIQNVKYCCPNCHARVLGQDKQDDSNADSSQQTEEKDNSELNKNARAFRIQAPLLSRTIAPSILKQLKTKEGDVEAPHMGQQFISFVDSRKAAAESTMKQNLQQERLWVYSRVFNALNKKRNSSSPTDSDEIQKLRNQYAKLVSMDGMEDAANAVKEKIDKELSACGDTSLSWNQVFDLLINEKECEWLAYQFVNKAPHNSEINSQNDKVMEESKTKYVLSIMIELLAHRPRQAASPETMGFLSTTYPKLNKITFIPHEVEAFNNKFLQDKKQIDLVEWKNLLKLFLDNVVRSNQSIFLKQNDATGIDIFACQRYGTKKPARRPTIAPHISDESKNKGKISAIAGLLGSLIPNGDNKPLSDVIYTNRAIINGVLDALWKALTETTELLQISQKYADGHWQVDEFKESDGTTILPYRLNVIDISFKATECACLVDSRSPGKKYPALRPIDTTFMGYSPYLIGNKANEPIVAMQNWPPYPYVDGIKGDSKITDEEIVSWAKENRSILCENGLWGEDGCFTSRLNEIFSYPDIFVQAEHTAQVSKLVSRHSQEMFKNQRLNILACSTTMEMGVDLGNLELVLMTSIPPHPSNYKQRAGRSGRNDDTRSACITLCGSDAVGLRTLDYPMEQLIKRKMQVPSVDLLSPQVIQRHANAFLFRASGVFFNAVKGSKNNLGQEVIAFFTPYCFDLNEKIRTFTIRTNDAESIEIYPDDGLGDETKTRYYAFLNYLNGGKDEEGNTAIESHKESLNKILRDTCFEQGADGCVERCKSDIRGIYESLETKVRDIAETYKDEKVRLLNSSKQSDKNKVKGRAVNSGYGYLLRHKFSECLAQNMLTFLATNRFTPNANMPVEIIEYNVNQKHDCKKNFTFKKSNNPSYALHEAISQYVPGNTVVLENKTSIIRGVAYTGQYKQSVTFKQIYSDGNNTVIDFTNRLESAPKEWPMSKDVALTLIEPVSFIPDINEDYSRVMERNSYTQVSAQLIGAGVWQSGDSNSMIAMRSNRDCCEAKILYYNEGIGYGYCFCPECGKTVLETKPRLGRFDIPEGMHDQTPQGDGLPFHYHIDRKDYKNSVKGHRIPCYSHDKIKRNVILGGLIQTDYCELKLKDFYGNWIQRNSENDRLLITLGILFTKAYTEYINKDRNDVSFALMPNGHLCIFDTNPGGSGYSNELAGQRTMSAVVDKAIEILNELKSKDAILDKFTLRYLDKLDIDTAKKWIFKLKDSMETVPSVVKDAYQNAKVAVVEDIYKDFRNYGMTNTEKMVFVNSDWDKWLYQPDFQSTQELTNGFKQRTHDIRYKAEGVKVVVCDAEKIPVPICRMMMQIEDWGKIYTAKNTLKQGFLPLAIIAGNIYFTTNKVSTNANFDWARCDVYYMPVNAIEGFNLEKYEINFDQSHIKKFVLGLSEFTSITSDQLGSIIDGKISSISNEFFNYCMSQSDKKVKVTYQDEHLKSPIAMITTLQLIEYFMKKTNNQFVLEFVNEIYDENPRGNTIFHNITNDMDRNDVLRDISDEWKETINRDGMDCTEIKITTHIARTLPHWRSLTFECNGKALCLYPNGGIINEWFEDRAKTNGKRYSVDDITTKEHVPLKRTKEIMYDAEIQEI